MSSCHSCGKLVYAMECMNYNSLTFHKWCFRCGICNTMLSIAKVGSKDGMVCCIRHLDTKSASASGGKSFKTIRGRNNLIISSDGPSFTSKDVDEDEDILVFNELTDAANLVTPSSSLGSSSETIPETVEKDLLESRKQSRKELDASWETLFDNLAINTKTTNPIRTTAKPARSIIEKISPNSNSAQATAEYKNKPNHNKLHQQPHNGSGLDTKITTSVVTNQANTCNNDNNNSAATSSTSVIGNNSVLGLGISENTSMVRIDGKVGHDDEMMQSEEGRCMNNLLQQLLKERDESSELKLSQEKDIESLKQTISDMELMWEEKLVDLLDAQINPLKIRLKELENENHKLLNENQRLLKDSSVIQPRINITAATTATTITTTTNDDGSKSVHESDTTVDGGLVRPSKNNLFICDQSDMSDTIAIAKSIVDNDEVILRNTTSTTTTTTTTDFAPKESKLKCGSMEINSKNVLLLQGDKENLMDNFSKSQSSAKIIINNSTTYDPLETDNCIFTPVCEPHKQKQHVISMSMSASGGSIKNIGNYRPLTRSQSLFQQFQSEKELARKQYIPAIAEEDGWVVINNGSNRAPNQYRRPVSYSDLLADKPVFYKKYFYEKPHVNYFAIDKNLGKLIISVLIEKHEINTTTATSSSSSSTGSSYDTSSSSNNRKPQNQYRLMLRSECAESEYVTVFESWIKNNVTKGLLKSGVSIKQLLNFTFPKLNLISKIRAIRDMDNELCSLLLQLDEDALKTKYKFGVCFTKKDQKLENEYLGNQEGSQAFNEFLNIIGDKVQLKGFQHFRAGLDVNSNTTGEYSVFTVWKKLEMMFHVATLLPYMDTNEQQLNRKAQIGNDIVVIIFCDDINTQFYSSSLVAQFPHVFIVVQRVEIDAAATVPGDNEGGSDCNNSNDSDSNPSHKQHIRYRVCLSKRLGVPDFKPQEWHEFEHDGQFRDFLLTTLVNAEHASYRAPKFKKMRDRTRKVYINSIHQTYAPDLKIIS